MYRITPEPIDLNEVHAAVSDPEAGGIAIFLGTVRRSNIGREVRFLEYEAYPEMARKKLAEIGEDARTKWPIQRIALIHRTGRLAIGEVSVAVAVSTPHRADAFAACRYLIDQIKAVVPVWKKEFFVGGEVWLENEEGFHPLPPGAGGM